MSTMKATLGPWEVGATGTMIYASEIEAGESNAYRPRLELARLTLDNQATAELIVRAVNALPVLVKALDRLIRTIEEYESECPIVVQRAADDASTALKLARGQAE